VNYIACFNDLDQHWPVIGDLIAPQGAIKQHRLLDRVADWLDAGRLHGTLRETLSPINAAT
jgi:hypothetical protein